jgi:hypothetical protein
VPSPTQSRATRPAQPPRAPRRRPAPPGPGSLLWPGLVAAAFTLAQLAFVTPRMGLSWDETVYVSQVSGHAPAALFDPARARGVPLLVAPVAAVTASVTALRCYLAVASGLALFVALLAWRGLRPAWLLALAGLTFAGLWTAQYYGPQAMPDLWVGLSALAAAGCFLHAARRLDTGPRRSARGPLAGLAAALASAALFRPGDAIFLAAPLLLAVLVVRAWRRWPLAAAVAAGLVAGSAEWVAEAYVRFGGVARRPPCLIRGEQFIPIAFVAGCASSGRPAVVAAPGRVAVLEWPHAPRPSYARHWTRHRLAGTRVLHLVGYIP